MLMTTKTDSSSNEENLSSGISSMSDDAQSLENGLADHDRHDFGEDYVRRQGDIVLGNRDDQYPSDQRNFTSNAFPLNKVPKQIDTIPMVAAPNISPRDNSMFGVIGGAFIPSGQIYTPFGDANKAYFLDSDLETIEEESSVLDSDFDDRSSVGYDRMPSSSDFFRERNQNLPGSISSAQSSSQRDSLTSARTVSDDERSSSTLSSISPERSSLSSRSDPSTPNNEHQERRNMPEIPVSMQNGTHNNSKPKEYEIGAIDPNLHQKIVYAKCLSPDEERRNNLLNFVPRPLEYHFSSKLNGPLSPAHTNHSLLDYRRQSTELTITDMFEAVRRGDVKTLNKFPHTEQSETADEKGNTILHAAASAGQLQCVQLLSKGSCAQAVSLLNDDLMTPAALSVQYGHSRCVQWLVENTSAKEELIVSSRQASIDGSNMRPPLAHVAARYNQDSVLDWLCEQMTKENFPVDSADHHSNTAVHEAAAHGHLKCLQTLVGRGASVTVLNSHGDTPGQVADKNGHDLCVGYLVVVETCMSLAQQLITVKLENEGITKENNALRMQIQAIHNAKLAHAKESVEERIRATLQSLSSYEEDNENPHPAHLNEYGHAKTNVASPPEPVQRTPIKNGRPYITTHGPPTKPVSQPTIERSTDKSLQMSARFATSNKQSAEIREAPGNDPLQGASYVRDRSQVQVNSTKEFGATTLPDERRERKIEPKTQGDNSKSPKQGRINEDNRNHSEVRNLTEALDHERKTQGGGNVPTQSQAATSSSQTVKSWEKMAMDEVLRLARDSRYLPSPTISMCTEDSTMETREVMRDRLAEASRWFLVQQSGKPRIKDAMLPGHRTRPVHTGAAFTRPHVPTSNATPRYHASTRNKVDSGSIRPAVSMPQRVSLPQNFVAATNQQYQALQHQHVTQSPQKIATHHPQQGSPAPSITSSSSSYRADRRDHSSLQRPTSARSSSSTASTVKSTLMNSSSSSVSNSTNLSQETVVENETPRLFNNGLVGSQGIDPLQKRGIPPGSPNSIRSHTSSSRPNSAKNPAAAMHDFDSINGTGAETAQVRVALPTRNNSFLRKVQPSSYPESSAQAAETKSSTGILYPSIASKSPSKRTANSPPTTKPQTVISHVKSPVLTAPQKASQANTLSPNGSVPSSTKNTINGTGYVMWKPSTKVKKSPETHTAVSSDSEHSLPPEKSKKTKSPSKHPYGGLFSSNSPKNSTKKKTTKLFHF